MARKHTYKPSTNRLDLALLASETATVQIEDVTKNLSPGIIEQQAFQGRPLYRPT